MKPLQNSFIVTAALLALAGLLLGGCTIIPQRELQTYRRTFDQVREQSENILADYAHGRQAKSNLIVRMANQQGEGPVGGAALDALLNLPRFDARTVHASVESDIDVRLRAWDVTAKYNEALLAMATGKAGELEATAHGLLDSLKKFPIKELSQAAAEAAPYAGAIIPIIELVQKEVEARRFRQAVVSAEPQMQKLFQALYDDANLFYKHRKAYLNDRFTFEEESFLVEAAKELQDKLNAQGWGASPDVTNLVTRVNAERVLAGGSASFQEIKFVPVAGAAAPAAGDNVLLALRAIADRIQTRARAARTIALELQSYRELMSKYGELLHAFEDSFNSLNIAAKGSAHHLPSLDQLETVISSVRVAYTVYTHSK
jgi:hypothetical protein